MSRQKYKRIQVCAPALLHRAQEQHRNKLFAIFVCVCCWQLLFSMNRYGLLCGPIMFLLRHVSPAGSENPGSGSNRAEFSTGSHQNPRHFRGGAGPDHDHFSNDAAVDLEMYGGEYDDISDMKLKRPLLPKTSYLYSGRLEDGQTAMAAETCGDGACSLHCLWGSLISTPMGNTFYCEDARAKLVDAMPDNVDLILESSCGPAVRSLLANLWSDTISHVIRRMTGKPPMPGISLLFLLGDLFL